jgi:hypothetical protein
LPSEVAQIRTLFMAVVGKIKTCGSLFLLVFTSASANPLAAATFLEFELSYYKLHQTPTDENIFLKCSTYCLYCILQKK